MATLTITIAGMNTSEHSSGYTYSNLAINNIFTEGNLSDYELASNVASVSISNIYVFKSTSLSFGLDALGGVGVETTSGYQTINSSMTVTSDVLNIGGLVNMTISGGTGNVLRFRNGAVIEISVQVQKKNSGGGGSTPSEIVLSVNTMYPTIGETSRVMIAHPDADNMFYGIVWYVPIQGSTRRYSKTTAIGIKYADYVIPVEWANDFTSVQQFNIAIQVQAYKIVDGQTFPFGNPQTAYQLVQIPSTFAPTITELTPTNTTSGVTVYAKGKHGVIVTATASVKAGATIASYEFTTSSTVEGTTTTSYPNRYRIGTLANTGTVTFQCVATDSRGYKSEPVECSIYVYDYAPPVITSYSAFRCAQNGIASDTGKYISISCSVSVSSVGGANSLSSIGSQYYYTGSSNWIARDSMTNGTTYIVGNNSIDTSRTYFVRFTVKDLFGSTTTLSVPVETTSYAIHVKNGGTGVAFGKTSEHDSAIEIKSSWDLYYKGVVMPTIIYSATTPSNPTTGMIWLKPKA